MKWIKKNKANIWFCIISIIILTFLLKVVYNVYDSNDQEIDILLLGDSIFGQYRDYTSISALLEDALNKTVVNGAFGGTTYSSQNSKKSDYYIKDSISFYELSLAIATNDFGVQQTLRMRENATDYFGDLIDCLDTIRYDSVETFILLFGTNDYNIGAPIENIEDPYDRYTVLGALRSGLRNITEKYPDAQILIVSPTYSWFINTMETCEIVNSHGNYLEEYVIGIELVAEEFGIDFIDLYHDFYPHEKYDDWSLYTSDGLHPNEEGRKLITDAIVDYMKGIER